MRLAPAAAFCVSCLLYLCAVVAAARRALGLPEEAKVVAILPGSRKLDFAAVAALFEARKCGFASPETAQALTGCVMGSVPPFALNPELAIVVEVDEVFLHCAKAFRRSHLWDPGSRQDRSEMPSLMQMILDDTTGAPDDPEAMTRMDENLEVAYRQTMY